MNEKEIKKNVIKTFDSASEGYDLPELRFFAESAVNLVGISDIKGHEKIFDVCTGTGHVAHIASKKLITGNITALDISEKMIEIAKSKHYDENKIKFICSDLDDFIPKIKFDLITCAFGIFFFPDMMKALQKMKSMLDVNGRIILSSFDMPFMEPQRGIFIQMLSRYGVPEKTSQWIDINTEEKFAEFLKINGFSKIDIVKKSCGYYLNDTNEWWNIIIYTNMRNYLTSLSETDLDKFKNEHLLEIEKLKVDGKGIWLDVNVMYAKIGV